MPVQVIVRVHSGGALLFEGSTTLRYANDHQDCTENVVLELRPAKSDPP
jgi:hypothetical protein